MADPLLEEIDKRLPELAWKTSLLPLRMTLQCLPKNLFSLPLESHPSECVTEIRRDIDRLFTLKRFGQEYGYLAKRVVLKIEVLVRLCQLEDKKQKPKQATTQLMMRLCHRRQWVAQLEDNIEQLEKQYQQMKLQISLNKTPHLQLAMQAELGNLEKKITLLKEKLTQTILA